MNHSIHIELDRAEGTLLRILGLVERRGFNIEACELYDLGEEKRGLTLQVRVRDAGRTIETLCLQIDRLYGITRLETAPVKAKAPAAKSQKQELHV